ncbi:MAG TPA: DOMON-like domain-containing protein [Parvularculaceae bacterium]|nr:DOMON-like domain-containing protein [Parvularculaceae bacterium]
MSSIVEGDYCGYSRIMPRNLTLHRGSTCDAATRIVTYAERRKPNELALRYVVHGAIGNLALPAEAASARRDELWRHTCFEAFVSAPQSAAYAEFNFSPSTEWAAYLFDGYRAGMRAALEMSAPAISMERNDQRFTLRAVVDLTPFAAIAGDALWRIGLSAVIEEASGRKSYWALAHGPGAPDFHHSDCFALELAAPFQA